MTIDLARFLDYDTESTKKKKKERKKIRPHQTNNRLHQRMI